MDSQLVLDINKFISSVNEIQIEQEAAKTAIKRIEEQINTIASKNKSNKEALDIATHAIEILREVSDKAVYQAYLFLEQSLNTALERMFVNTTRKIKLHEYTRNNQYPQLEIQLTVAGGKQRSLRADSGHGLAQIVSILSIISLIVVTNSRRLLVMDEVLSGLSAHNREIVSDILWTFTTIGFQFVVNEHGFIPKGSKVYHMEMVGDVSHIKNTYISENGLYLDGAENLGKE